ncbi:hypothetical protein Cflav_PD0442 [Pedosphaera parvula Ellin514]|uniref:Uncharacterized protein n=1 Tax=Pedosphaera parvula (strain Ellin514) TaxID=320771 RepID=B9XRP0_PEDPL|nr:hypothetical protein Cflav_PD0442 [Pedosphaera parvula Ellin514]
MNVTRALIWGILGGVFFGLAMFLVMAAISPDLPDGSVRYAILVWYTVHRPILPLLNHLQHFYQAVALFVGYWTVIAVFVALVVWRFRTWRVRHRTHGT